MLRQGESALHLMHWDVVHIHQTLYGHIRTTSSCRLLFVLRTYMSMLLDSVIQHGIDGAHRQWFTLPYTMA